MLLVGGADLNMTSKRPRATDQEPDGIIRYDKTPAYCAIKSDKPEVLDVLMQHGLSERHDLHMLLTMAVQMFAVECTKYLATKVDLRKDSNVELLSLATSRGIDFIKAILSVGYSYDITYFKENPQLLKEYYSKVGLNRRNFENSCCEFTRLILDKFDGKTMLYEELNAELVHLLLQRMGKRHRRFDRSTREQVEEVYRDLQSAIEEILNSRPEIINIISPEMINVCLNAANVKTVNPRYNKWHGVAFINTITFLVAKGFSLPFYLLADIQDSKKLFGAGPYSKDSPEFVHSKLELIDTYLTKESGIRKTTVCSKFKWESCGHTLQEKLTYYTKLVSILYKHGLDIYELPGHHLSAIENRTLRRERGTELTHFQSIVIHISNESLKTQEIHHIALMFSTLVLLAGQRVIYSKELHYLYAFYPMCYALANVFDEHLNRASELGRAIAKIVLHVCHFLIFYLNPKSQRDMLLILNIVQQNVSRYGKSNIDHFIIENLHEPMTHEYTLKKTCFFRIRKLLSAKCAAKKYGDSNSNIPRYRAMVHPIGKEKPIWIMDALSADGLSVDGHPLLQNEVHALPLPPYLKSYLLGDTEMQSTLCKIWNISHQNLC